ncbi:MAG: FAD:protein FMN transferase [Candidatus Acetothermia bacterium]
MTKQRKNTNDLTRRRFLKWTAGGVLGAGALTLGIRPWKKTAKGQTTVSTTRPAMGTFVEIKATGEDESRLNEAVDKAYKKIAEVDETMSVFKEGSQVRELNREGRKELTVNPEVMEVLKRSKKIAELTDGSFDVTSAPLLDLWGFYGDELQVPSEEEIERTLKLIDHKELKLHEASGTVSLPDKRSAIDLGGVAKGYAVDKGIKLLKEEGLASGLINAGGDIRGFGSPEGKENWRVGLQDPTNEDELLAGMDLILPAVTTSGNYESFFTYRGSRLGHIIDPETGRPVEDVLSVSVLTEEAVMADGLSTAAFSQGAEEAVATASRLEDTELIYIKRSSNGRTQVELTEGLKGVVDGGKLEVALN